MIKPVWLSFIILLVVLPSSAVQASISAELELAPQQQILPVPVSLTEDNKHWLAKHKELRVGVYPQAYSPAVESLVADKYRGMNADYLAIIQNTLDKPVKVINFDSKQHAIQALKNGELDTVLTGLDYRPKKDESLISSIAVTRSWPSLVASVTNTLSPLTSEEEVRVSTVGNYPDSQFIHESFPNARVIRYRTYEEALNALSAGEDNYLLGDSLTTSIWLSQEFRNTIITLKYWENPQKESLFLFSAQQPELQNMVNHVLSNIDESIHSQIVHSVIDRGDLSFLIDPITFTANEKQWLETHKKIRVIVNLSYVPFTLIDSKQEIRGITGDLLNLIHLQTGLTFEPVIVRSYDEMMAEMNKGDWDIAVPTLFDANHSDLISYTQPFVNTQFVSVVRKENLVNAKLAAGMRVAISDEDPLLAEMQKKYPNIEWMPVKNVSVALNLVASDKVDAAVANRLAARYFSEHYYPNQLSWQAIPDAIPAAFTIGVSSNEPLLKSILDKARDDIPQHETFQVTSKWLRLPSIKIETWELQNKSFYLITILATLLILSSTLWAIYLTIEIRKRKRSQNLLIQEKDKAQQASKENLESLSRISHEIRTPVSAIVGYLELLQHASIHFQPEDKVSIDQATKAAHSLLKLIGDILNAEPLSTGMIDVSPKWGKINNLIMAEILFFHPVVSKKGLTLDYTSTPEARQAMLLDFQLLGKVLNNIIGNAVKFTQQGGINISVELQNKKTLLINVTDTGSGIPQEMQERLFETFIQTGYQTKEQVSGLGLTISKALISKMNGSILLDSEVNKGTTITIILPVETVSDGVTEAFPATESTAKVDQNIRILIADDQPAGRLLLQRQLATLGITPDEAADGQEALRLLQENPYDILITDVNMPTIDGITLTQKIREHNSHITICGLTAAAQPHERERCLAAGMNACLFKPMNISQLLQLLSEIEPEVNPFFDMKRLTVLAQGNRLLMQSALRDAQQENYRDLEKAHQALIHSDYPTMKYHVHRIRGTALLLGAVPLAEQTQQLEEKLLVTQSDDGLADMLESVRVLLAELDLAVGEFKP